MNIDNITLDNFVNFLYFSSNLYFVITFSYLILILVRLKKIIINQVNKAKINGDKAIPTKNVQCIINSPLI